MPGRRLGPERAAARSPVLRRRPRPWPGRAAGRWRGEPPRTASTSCIRSSGEPLLRPVDVCRAGEAEQRVVHVRGRDDLHPAAQRRTGAEVDALQAGQRGRGPPTSAPAGVARGAREPPAARLPRRWSPTHRARPRPAAPRSRARRRAARPTPYVVARSGSRRSGGVRWSPQACALSTYAVSPADQHGGRHLPAVRARRPGPPRSSPPQRGVQDVDEPGPPSDIGARSSSSSGARAPPALGDRPGGLDRASACRRTCPAPPGPRIRPRPPPLSPTVATCANRR